MMHLWLTSCLNNVYKVRPVWNRVYFHLIKSQEVLIVMQFTTFLPFAILHIFMVFSLQTKHITFLFIWNPSSLETGYNFILEQVWSSCADRQVFSTTTSQQWVKEEEQRPKLCGPPPKENLIELGVKELLKDSWRSTAVRVQGRRQISKGKPHFDKRQLDGGKGCWLEQSKRLPF